MTYFKDLFDTLEAKISISLYQRLEDFSDRNKNEKAHKARNMLFTYDGKTADLMAVEFKWAYKQIFKRYATANNYIEFIVDLYGHRNGWSKEHVIFVIDYIYYKNLEHHFKAIKKGAFAPSAHIEGDLVEAHDEFKIVEIINSVIERGIDDE